MIDKSILEWITTKYIELLNKNLDDYESEDCGTDLLAKLKNDVESLGDGYNYAFKNYPIIILDNYGDDDPLDLMSTKEYNDYKYWEKFNKGVKKPLNEVRLDIYESICLVDNHLDCYLIDIKKDNTYEIKEYINKKPITIDESLLKLMFGGKRAYYWYADAISLKFYKKYENYLKANGLYKEENREGCMTAYRITIGR